jgi:hypothetical protein
MLAGILGDFDQPVRELEAPIEIGAVEDAVPKRPSAGELRVTVCQPLRQGWLW